MTTFLLSTVGKRGYLAKYLRRADPSVRTIGTGNEAFTPGFRDVDLAVLVPSIGSSEYLDAVRTAVAEHDVDAVLTFSDPDCAALAPIREELTAQGVQCFFPGADGARMAFDKLETFAWAGRNGFLSPDTVGGWEAARDRFGSTFVAKPRTGSASAGLVVVGPDDDESVLTQDVEYIFQEQLVGEEVNVEVLSDLCGRPVRLSAWRKLRSRNGETELAITVRDDRLLSLAERLSRCMAIPGPSDIDLIRVDQSYHLIEINARFGGGYPVSDLAGARFPEALVALTRGEDLDLSADYEADIFMMKSLQPFGGRLADLNEVLNL